MIRVVGTYIDKLYYAVVVLINDARIVVVQFKMLRCHFKPFNIMYKFYWFQQILNPIFRAKTLFNVRQLLDIPSFSQLLFSVDAETKRNSLKFFYFIIC